MSEMNMSTIEEQKFKKALNDYLEYHDLQHLFLQMMHHLNVHKPIDPISYLESFLMRYKDSYSTSFRRVFVIGQPLSMFNQLSQEFQSKGFTDMEVISMENLLLQHNASSIISTGDLNIPQAILSGRELCELLQLYINESDKKENIRKKGFILCGFPQNRDQALALQEIGFYPDHVLVLEFLNAIDYEKKLQAVDYDSNVQTMQLYYQQNRLSLLECFQKDIITIVDAQLPEMKIMSIWNTRLRGMKSVPKLVVLGPPGSGKTSISQQLELEYGVIRVDCRELNTKESNNSVSFLHLLKKRLLQQDVLDRGWVIDDIESVEAARFMVDNGFFPDAVINLNIPDDSETNIILDRIKGRRFDMINNTIINEKLIQTKEPSIQHQNFIALPRDAALTLDQLKNQIVQFNQLAPKLISMFEGHVIVKDVNALMSMDRVISEAVLVSHGQTPQSKRVCIIGSPCSGKTTQCNVLQKKYQLVRIDIERLIEEYASSSKLEIAQTAKRYISCKRKVPVDIVTLILKNRLLEKDCLNRGWVLDGYPTNSEEFEAMKKHNIIPNTLILLDMKGDHGLNLTYIQITKERIEGRYTDPETDCVYHKLWSPAPLQKIIDRSVLQHIPLDLLESKANEFESNVRSLKESVLSGDSADFVEVRANPVIATVSNDILHRTFEKSQYSPIKIIIMGPPAGGKGTASEIIKREYGVVHLSTGDILRNEIRNRSDLGLTAQTFMDNGALVPDDLIINMITKRLKEEDCVEKGWLLDGFPRTASQAEFMMKAGIISDAVILLECPDEMVIERISGRRTDPVTGAVYHVKYNPPMSPEIAQRLVQRSDDTEEKLKIRLGNYYDQVNSMLKFFPGIVHRIDAGVSMTEVSNSVLTTLKQLSN